MKESRMLEFKQDITNTFLKTVSAFANYGAGSIQFGVDDNGNSVGLSDPESTRLDLENKINDSIHPRPEYSITVNQKSKVITLNVSEGKQKPYLYKGKAYRRSDTSTVEVDGFELKRLVLEGSNLYFEELPCGKDDLGFRYLETKMIEILGIQKINEDILRTLGFINKEKEYINAAAIFADTNQFYGIDIARFGNSINEILDRETIKGVSVLEQYDKAVSAFKRYYQYEVIEGIERKNVELLPEKAFREAVANALVHREWDMNSHVRIAMFSDRIEVTSPGGLPRGLTKEEYMNGDISILRNPIIGNMFFRLHYIEMFGTGIRRINDAYKDALIKPDFRINDNSITVILPCLNKKIVVNTNEQKVLDVLKNGRVLSSMEIAEELGWSKVKAIRVLNALIDAGYIQKDGSGRGTHYLRK